MSLTPDADRLWNRLRNEPALAGFVLIGDSALALHLGHRISEDLDFVLRGLEDHSPLKLLRIALKSLLVDLRSAGVSIEDRYLPADDVRDFEVAGMDPEDFQQEYLMDGVKINFFVPESPKIIESCSPRSGWMQPLYLALKRLVCCDVSFRKGHSPFPGDC